MLWEGLVGSVNISVPPVECFWLVRLLINVLDGNIWEFVKVHCVLEIILSSRYGEMTLKGETVFVSRAPGTMAGRGNAGSASVRLINISLHLPLQQ